MGKTRGRACGRVLARMAMCGLSAAWPLMIGGASRGASWRDAGLLLKVIVVAALVPVAAHAQGVTVSHSGTPSYSHKITVPPGIAGMAPNLAISYSASGTNGPVGYGWGLSGTSVITRCHATLAIDGPQRKGVANAPDDKLCLDGQRLIQTDANGSVLAFPQSSDSLGGDGLVHEYRTEKDSFARIRAYGKAGGLAANGPAYFKVWTKDGRIHEYGTNTNATAGATITPVDKPVVVAWAVSRISDRRGNYIDFQYDQRDVSWGTPGPTGREWNLIEVRYTGTASQAPSSKVVFVYEDRPSAAPAGAAHDRAEVYVLGSKHASVRRLAKVQTFINITNSPVKVRTTKLSYVNGTRTNRSLLQSITECVGASDDVCLPSNRFEYEPGANEQYQANTAFANSQLASLAMHSVPDKYGPGEVTVPKVGVLTGDFNGDGRTDLLRWGDNPAENSLWTSNGDGTFQRVTAFNITEGLMRGDPDPCYQARAADFNGDGLADIFRFRKPSGRTTNGGTTSCSGVTTVFMNNGDGTFAAKPLQGVAPYEQLSLPTKAKSVDLPTWEEDLFGWTRGETYYILDTNGDGRLDIITAVLPSQTAVPDGQEPDNPCASVVCTRVFLGDGQGAFNEVANVNVAYRTLYSAPVGPTNWHVVDADGDGLPELSGVGAFGYYHDGPHTFRSRGDGNLDEVPGSAACSKMLDFNGDGRNDCIRTTASAAIPQAVAQLFLSDGAAKLTYIPSNFPYPLSEVVEVNDYQTGEKRVASDAIAGDFDGDGRGDLLYWNTDPSRNTIFLSNGDGTFRESTSFNLKAPENLLQDARSTAALVVGDFTGRGQVEILRLRAAPTTGAGTSNQLYTKSGASVPADRLAAIVSSTGARTSFTWVPLASSASGSLGARYRSDRGTSNAAVYPDFDAVSTAHVVATSVEDSGVGASVRATEYAYYGLKVNHEGRGSLGFREVRRQGQGPDGSTLTEVSRVAQRFPYTGMNSSSEVWLGGLGQSNPSIIRRSESVLCDTTAAAGAEAAATTGTPCPSTSKLRRPYTYKSTEQSWELGAPPPADAVISVVTTSTLNRTGDPTRIVASSTGKVGGADRTYTKTTDHIYKPDATSGDDWHLGRVEKTTLRHAVPNLLGALAASAGSSRYATSITVIGSQISVTSNTASALSAVKGAAPAQGTVIFANTGDTPATLTLSGLSAPFSLSPSSCNVEAGSACTVTVLMSTTGSIGSQGSRTLTATGGNNGPVTAAVSGTLLGSVIAVTTNGAGSLSALKGAAAATGAVTFTNSGNQAATLTLSGLSAPYSVSPSSCTVAAGGGTCTVTVSMATSGSIGAQGAQTITAAGGTTGNAMASIAGTVTGSIATLVSGNLSFGTATLDTTAPTRTLTLRNDGNVNMTLSGLSGLSTPLSTTGNTCSNVAPGASCAITVTLSTSSNGSWSQTATTAGATQNASTGASAAVSGSIASFIGESGTALDLGSVGQSGTAPTRSWAFRNDGNAYLTLSLSALNSPFSATNYCGGSVAPGNTCSIVVQMGTGTVGTFSQGGIAVSGAARGSRSDFSVSGSVIPSNTTVSASPTSLSWSSVAKGSTTTRTLTLTNTGSVTATGLNYAVSYTTTSSIGDHYLSGGTCPGSGGSLAAGASCTVIVAFAANCSGGTRNGTLNVTGNFSALAVPLNASVTSSGTCE